MVATKRVLLPEVDNGKEKRPGANEGVSVFQEPLAGFIFVCNNDTIGEDFERHLFGLPQRYHDSVKSIQPGLPLFLYNYSTRCLHGVFEASSDGGLNIEPDAWGENKDSRKNGRQSISRFPAQVRVRWREERPPLEEEKFRPVLYHYDGPKFRLQLSKSEVHELLELFGASPMTKVEEPQEDTGGEWEKVKTKSKTSRTFRATLLKGSISPNSTSGRRRGSTVNGPSSNGGALPSSLISSVHEAVIRGREGEIKSDSAQRWRTDSDSWSGSSSAGTASSNCGSHDEDRSKKNTRENGCIGDVSEVGSPVPSGDKINGTAFPDALNGSLETDLKSEIRTTDDDSNDVNGFSSNMGATSVSNANARPGFVSYSAALKSGMLGVSVAENGSSENHVSSPREIPVALNGNNNVGTRSSVSSYSSAASGSSVPLAGPVVTAKGDATGDRADSSKQKLDVGWTKARSHPDILSNNHGKVGIVFGVANGKEEPKVDLSTTKEGDDKKVERLHPWGKPLTVRSTPQEIGSGQSTTTGDQQKSVVKTPVDSSAVPKKMGKDGSRITGNEGENGEQSAGPQRQANSEAKESSAKPVERKNVWQTNDGAVLRLLHDPDPAVNSTSGTSGTTEQKIEPELPKKSQRPVFQSPEDKSGILQSLPSDVRQVQYLKQNSSGALLSHNSHSKVSPQDPPLFQQSRSFHEPRRQQFDNQKYEKQQDERPHYRKQQGHSQEHPQHTSSMLHTQQHQGGQGLMPLRVPTPPSPGMQHHHQPLLSPSPQAVLYRDRSRNGRANGAVDSVHGLAYRPISRNLLDGEVAMQSQLMPGSWGLPSPVLLMQPVISPITGSLTFPTPSQHLLANVDALHTEILEFARAATPSTETRMHAEAAVECVRRSVKQLWPDADVEVFGSFATGLCLHHSDVDVVVVDAPLPQDTAGVAALSGARLLTPMIRDLATSLKECEWCEGLNTIETASMPVIKLRCKPSTEELSPVAIDITIGGRRSATFAGVSQGNLPREAAPSKPVNPKFEAARNAHNGAAAREFVIERLRLLPALAPLVLLLKSFLRCRNLNDVYSGGLGSFALTLMLVFYLERVPISCGTPQEVPKVSKASKSPPTNSETSSISVDTTRASVATTESVDFSDDDSSDSSVLTSTSVSSMVSTEVASLQGSSCGGDSLPTPPSSVIEEPVLRKAGGIVEELLGSMHSVTPPNLGKLLVGFLHFFSHEIDFSRVRLVLKGKNGSAGGVFWHEKNARTLPLCIDDPLRPDAYIGAGSFNIWQVQAAMREMLALITRPLSRLPDGLGVGNVPDAPEHLPLLHQFLVSDIPV